MPVRKCDRCGKALRERTAVNGPYQYKLSGMSNVFLIGISVRHCTGCGRESPVIPKLGQLHEVIAKVLSNKPGLLAGEELRFLRKNAGISARDFAKKLGVDPSHLSRFETRRTKQLGTSTDKLARAIVGAAMDWPDELRSVLLRAAKDDALRTPREKRGGKKPTFKLEHDHWRAA